jgi:hypothetical protein
MMENKSGASKKSGVKAKKQITQLKASKDVNTDIPTWVQQFRKAVKKGGKPEKDLFEGMSNEFDENEW